MTPQQWSTLSELCNALVHAPMYRRALRAALPPDEFAALKRECTWWLTTAQWQTDDLRALTLLQRLNNLFDEIEGFNQQEGTDHE